MVHKCLTEGCETQIEDKYKFCMPCVSKMKQANQEVVAEANSDEVVKAIGALNNNAYAIRTILEAMLEKQHKLVLRWDKKEVKFVIEKKAKKAKQ
jgi:Txe/YoeB family toxin of Txe-Axe toxin-antitoxin module